MPQRRSALPWVACGITVALTLARLTLAITDPDSASPITNPRVQSGGAGLALFEVVAFSALAGIGALVATRRPGNPVGVILCTTPLFLEIANFCETLYFSLTIGHPRGRAVDLLIWVDNWAWVPAIIPYVGLVPLLFPTGRPPGPRWRIAGRLTVAGCVLVLVGFAITPGTMQDYGVDNPVVTDPGLRGIGDALTGIGFLLSAGGVLGGAASLVHRFRRARGVERLQLKWVTTTLALLAVAWAVMAVVPSVTQNGGFDTGWIIVVTGLLALAVSIAIATIRHRLYDIDVVIRRTLVYTALTAALAAVYAGTVLALQAVLSPLTDASGLAVAGSTLVVAGAFRPARARIQAAVDRRFFRSRYDAQRTLEAFGVRLRDQIDLAALSTELQSVVQTTMQPAHLSLWLRP